MEEEKIMVNDGKRLTVRMPEITRTKLDIVAKKRKTKPSKLLRELIFDFLSKQ